MSNESTMQVLEEKDNISLEEIVLGWEVLFGSPEENVFDSLQLIDEPQYMDLRTTINDAFQVGETPEFAGFVEEDTELGDVTDVLIGMLQDKYPPEKCADSANTIMLSVEQRKAWRDELIEKLDEMVER
jgi:hypothetical protein